MRKPILAAWLALAACAASASQFTTDAPCDVRFSPRGGATEAIVNLINGAQRSIKLMAYNFTSQRIGEALVDAKLRGVNVELVLDYHVPGERGSLLPMMVSAGIPSWIDKKHPIAHNKVIIVDGKVIETGSFNYTDNAEENGENAVICPSVSGAFVYGKDFMRHKRHSKLINPEAVPPDEREVKNVP